VLGVRWTTPPNLAMCTDCDVSRLKRTVTRRMPLCRQFGQLKVEAVGNTQPLNRAVRAPLVHLGAGPHHRLPKVIGALATTPPDAKRRADRYVRRLQDAVFFRIPLAHEIRSQALEAIGNARALTFAERAPTSLVDPACRARLPAMIRSLGAFPPKLFARPGYHRAWVQLAVSCRVPLGRNRRCDG
jgi:hypothetical protein